MVSLKRTVLLALVLTILGPAAAALGGLDVPLLVRDVDDAIGGTAHGALAPVEAPASAPSPTPAPAATPAAPAAAGGSGASGAPKGGELESSGKTTAPAPIETVPQATASLVLWPWVVTLGAAFVGVGASALRGPLSRVRDDGFAVFWRVLLGGLVLATAAVLLYADWSALASGPAWLAFTTLAWIALLVGALAVRAIGSSGWNEATSTLVH